MEKWHLVRIPKILHCYYGGKLPFLSYLTVTSFMAQNPDWDVMFYYPKKATKKRTWDTNENKFEARYKDYTKRLLKLRITATEVDFEKYGVSNDISEVHKSDIIRWHLLSSMGGMWSDMDILYFKPLTKLIINRLEYAGAETVVSISHYGHSIGFMMGCYDNAYYDKLRINVIKSYKKESYQCMGSEMCNRLFPTIKSIPGNTINLGMDAVYHFNADQIDKIFAETNKIDSLLGIVGIHWFNGHTLAGKFLHLTDGGLKCENYPNTISNLILSMK